MRQLLENPSRKLLLLAVITATLILSQSTTQAYPAAASQDVKPKGNTASLHNQLESKSQSYLKASQLLGETFRRYDTERYILLSDADPDWTRQQGRYLERTYHQFHRFTKWLKLQPLPLQHKLVCILFQNRSSYQRFAATHDGISAPWIAGYFSPKHDWTAFYHVEASPSLSAAREQLSRMTADLRRLEAKAKDAAANNSADLTGLNERVALYRDHLKKQQLRVNVFATETSTATTIHEGVHQLMFHTRIQSPLRVYPLWISEGLAMNFETTTPNQAFGPQFDSPLRHEQFEEVLRNQQLITLSELIELEVHPPNEEKTMRTIYAQSYGLIAYLSRFHRPELRHYLESMRTIAPIHLGSGQQRSIFIQCFGNPDELEARWLRYEHARLAANGPSAYSTTK